MIIKRDLVTEIKFMENKMPVVAVLGPRQSGKTTLVKNVFPDRSYVTLESPDNRRFAEDDPREFLARYKGGIIDEMQRVPDLFSYMQEFVDQENDASSYIITGSSNFLMMENISQSLAGRVALLRLFPLSIREFAATQFRSENYHDYIFGGGYPRIYDKKIPPEKWYPQYIETYLERDVRRLKNISDISTFQRFMMSCAGRIGKEVNLEAIGNDCGITHNTVKSWLSVLEASFIALLLKPYHNNFRKIIVKSPKLYFYDTGIVCSLLGISAREQLDNHFARGELFENLMISEIVKNTYHQGKRPAIFFWKNHTGNEINCILERGGVPTPIEIKSGTTINSDYFKGLRYWNRLTNNDSRNAYVVYGGSNTEKRQHGNVLSWQAVPDLNEIIEKNLNLVNK